MDLLHVCHLDEVFQLVQEGIDLVWAFLVWEHDRVRNNSPGVDDSRTAFPTGRKLVMMGLEQVPRVMSLPFIRHSRI